MSSQVKSSQVKSISGVHYRQRPLIRPARHLLRRAEMDYSTEATTERTSAVARRHRSPRGARHVRRRTSKDAAARDHGGIVTSFSDLPTAHAAAALRHPTQQRTKCRAVVCTLQVQHANQDTRTHAPTVALSSVSAAHCRDRVPCHICTPTRRTHLVALIPSQLLHSSFTAPGVH